MNNMSKEMNLNPKLFDEDVEQIAIRQGFGEGLLEAGEKDERIVGLCADLTGSTKMNLFADKFPERFVQVGIAEQNLASVASGMAAMGKIPFITSYAMFNPGRNWEQIRTTICYNDQPVKIVGSHAGVSVGPDGGTHQAIEDIAITRVIPRMVVLTPCDSIEAKKATIEAAKTDTPVYIRLAREATPVITTEDTPFEIGKAQVYFRPSGDASVGVIASGALLHNAIIAAKQLEEDGIKVRVMNLATIKPIDRDAIIKLAEEVDLVVTVEEHQVAGGMGSAVAEVLSQNHPTKMKMIGIEDQFGQSGEPNELIAHYGLDVDSIKKTIKELV